VLEFVLGKVLVFVLGKVLELGAEITLFLSKKICPVSNLNALLLESIQVLLLAPNGGFQLGFGCYFF